MKHGIGTVGLPLLAFVIALDAQVGELPLDQSQDLHTLLRHPLTGEVKHFVPNVQCLQAW